MLNLGLVEGLFTVTDSLSVVWRAELVRPNIVSLAIFYLFIFFETADFV